MVNASRESKSKSKSKKATVGGFDMSPLISALLLATIKLAISQKNKKLGEQKKVSKSKSKQK